MGDSFKNLGRRDKKREKLETGGQLEGYFTGPLGEVVGTTIVMAVGISQKGKIQRLL